MFYSCVCLGTLAQENDFLSPLSRRTWKCHHLFGFCGVFWGALIEGCGDALWSEVHVALAVVTFVFKQTRGRVLISCASSVFSFIYYSISPSFFPSSCRRYAGPVEVASPPRKDQRQPLEAEGDRWLRDCQSRPKMRFSALNCSH